MPKRQGKICATAPDCVICCVQRIAKSPRFPVGTPAKPLTGVITQYTSIFSLLIAAKLWNSFSSPAEEEKNHAHHQEHKEY
jgi:hypothetical protein